MHKNIEKFLFFFLHVLQSQLSQEVVDVKFWSIIVFSFSVGA